RQRRGGRPHRHLSTRPFHAATGSRHAAAVLSGISADAERPLGLPGSSAADRPAGVSECFGTLRYGGLAEFLLYDIRRTQTLTGPSAVFVAPVVEQWLKARMAAPGVAHVVNIPSNPPGWSAG